MPIIHLKFPVDDRAEKLAKKMIDTVKQNNPDVIFPKKITFGGDYSGWIWIQYKRNDVRDAIVEQAKKDNVFNRID